MKLTSHFADFLKDTVNLNATRIATLDDRSAAIKKFVRQADWGATVRGFEEQGSWAHGTIIKPVDQGEFDADLLVLVDPVEGWSAKDYVKKLLGAFRESETYKGKSKAWDYCVTITYANDAKVDVAPLIVGRETEGELEVCNKKADAFERSEPIAYTDWLIEKNGYSGGNSFRKVTRLLKYLRDIKGRFVCPSVLLTTLIAQQIEEDDKGSAGFADVPSTLQTIMGRLDDWLQQNEEKPSVCNPFLSEGDCAEDFAAAWSEDQYLSFRKSISRYRGWIDEAMASADRDASVKAWRRLFGDDFAPDVVVQKASLAVEGRFALAENSVERSLVRDLVDAVLVFGRSAIPRNFNRVKHMQQPQWQSSEESDLDVTVRGFVGGGPKSMYARSVLSAEPLRPNQKIYFDVVGENGQPLGGAYEVHWRITNTGDVPSLRGEFCPSNDGHEREETLAWRGVHMAEAFVIRRADNRLSAVSEPFYVVIEG